MEAGLPRPVPTGTIAAVPTAVLLAPLAGPRAGSLLAYPSATGGFFLKAGVGYASDEYRRLADTDPWFTESRPGMNLGLGHGVQLGDGCLYLTPNVDLMLGMFEYGLDNPDASLVFTMGLGFR